MRLLYFIELSLVLFILSCSDSTKSKSNTNINLINPDQLLPNTDSIEVMVSYGTEALIVFQGKKGEQGFEGPYEISFQDPTNENFVLRVYEFDSQGNLLSAKSHGIQNINGIDSNGIGSGNDAGTLCKTGYTCYDEPGTDVVWVMKNDGNVNGPSCKQVCETALEENSTYQSCDEGRAVAHKDIPGFATIANGLGFSCREGGCWWPDAPSNGLYLVSINTGDDGSKTCFFPTETEHSCSTHPGNANCYGERYASVCPCVPKPLDQACNWDCPPNNTTQATWDTSGTSCLQRINYWRKRACDEGWVECPPSGLPPMVECTACHECANSEAAWDKINGAHNSFKRCGERVQGEGGGATCANVIDAFVSERAPDEFGVMRCRGHCGPILSHGCQTFHWGKDSTSGFHTLNWRSCNFEQCNSYCDDNPGACFTHETSPSLTCAE